MAIKVLAKRGTASQIEGAASSAQTAGEIAFATDTKKFYVSDGTQFNKIEKSDPSWGDITGSLSDQTDLYNELTAKELVANKSNDANLGESAELYPTQRAVKAYVDNEVSNIDLSSKEDVSNKSTNTSLGTSNTLYPSQNAVKSYVDSGLSPKENTSNKSTDVTMGGASPSSTLYTTEYAVSTYVQNEIAQAQSGIPTFEIDMFANYKVHETDEDGTTTFVGKIKATNGNWLVEKFVDNSGDITATYANASNNSSYTTLATAWTNRSTLTYTTIDNLTSI